jgi:hypothetical protein
VQKSDSGQAHLVEGGLTGAGVVPGIFAGAPDVFRRDPVNLIRIFHLADRHGLSFHPDAMRIVARCSR